MSISKPSIAIAMPLGRLSPWFEDALSSALSQTVRVPIYLIANGLQSEEIIRLEELTKIHDQLRLCIYEERVSIYENWNRIFNEVDEEYFGMLHDDDLLEPWAMEKLMSMVGAIPNQGIYFTSERIIDENGAFHYQDALKFSSNPQILNPIEIVEWATSNRICATGFLINRQMAISSGGFSNDLPFTADWNLYFAVGSTYGSCFSDINCGRYRLSSNTGQSTNSLVRDGLILHEYRRQQIINLSKIRVSPKSHKNKLDISLSNQAKIILNYFGSSLDPTGMIKVRDAILDGWIAKYFFGRQRIAKFKPVNFILYKLINMKYPKLNRL